MTKARNEYIYQLAGTIHGKKPKKASSKSKYAGQSYCDLVVTLENPYEHIKIIQVFPGKLENSPILEAIEKGNCLQQKYRFFCRNRRGYYYLVNWEELNNE